MRVIDVTTKSLVTEIVKCCGGDLADAVKLEWIKHVCEMLLESWDTISGEGLKPGVPVALTIGAHTITVLLEDKTSGTISSNLHVVEAGGDVEAYNAEIDGLESLVLAHACAGVNISDKRYIAGLQSAIEGIENNT